MKKSMMKFYSDINDRPVRVLTTSFSIILIFHSIRFWIRQIGTFNTVNVPISVFTPSVGKELLLGPIIEIVQDLESIGPLKNLIFGILILSSILWIIFKVLDKKISSSCEKFQEFFEYINIGYSALVFLLIPIFFLPKLKSFPLANLWGAIAVVLFNYLFLFKKEHFTAFVTLVALIFSYFSIYKYYQVGQQLPYTCSLYTTLVMDNEGKNIHQGCWISSSDSYVLIRKKSGMNSSTLAILRSEIKRISFGMAGGIQ